MDFGLRNWQKVFLFNNILLIFLFINILLKQFSYNYICSSYTLAPGVHFIRTSVSANIGFTRIKFLQKLCQILQVQTDVKKFETHGLLERSLTKNFVNTVYTMCVAKMWYGQLSLVKLYSAGLWTNRSLLASLNCIWFKKRKRSYIFSNIDLVVHILF